MMARILGIAAIAVVTLIALVVVIAVGFRGAAALRETAERDQVAPSTGRLIATRSGRVFIRDKGPHDGPTIVLIHGTAAWSQLWWRTTDALTAAGYRVIAFDLPPFGYSDRPGNYTRADQAARIEDVLATLGINRAIIVGHSFGAGAAVEYVLRDKDRAHGLVLVDAALGLNAPPSNAPLILSPTWVRQLLVSLTVTNPLATRTLLSSLIARKEAANADNVAILQAPLTRRHSTSHIADWLAYFAGSDRNALSAGRETLAGLPQFVAIIWGDKDTVTPMDQALDLKALLPRAALTVLPGLGHIPQIEDPDAFNRALLDAVAHATKAVAVGPQSPVR